MSIRFSKLLKNEIQVKAVFNSSGQGDIISIHIKNVYNNFVVAIVDEETVFMLR